jgi:putative ATP-dependent endonuclease of the OLD family
LDGDGLPCNGVVTAAAAFAIMAAQPAAKPHIDALHNQMLAHRIWVWRRGAIEDHLGLAAKTAGAHLAFLNGCKTEAFRTAMPDHQGLRAMFAWARQP